MSAARRRLLLVLLVGLLPWTVVVTNGFWTLLHPLGLFNFSPTRGWSFVFLTDYLFVRTRGLPEFILAWPTGVVVYVVALVSAALGLVDHEDRRLTAGLLVLAGLTQLSVASGFGRRTGYVAVPVATIAMPLLVWWVYWPALRAMFLGPDR